MMLLALGDDQLNTEALEKDAARFAAGVLSLDGLAALHSMDTESVLAVLENPEAQKRIELLVVTREQSGDTSREIARRALASCLRRIAQIVEDPETSTTMLLRATEILDRLSPLTPKAIAAPLDRQGSITIVFSNETKKIGGDVIDV